MLDGNLTVLCKNLTVSPLATNPPNPNPAPTPPLVAQWSKAGNPVADMIRWALADSAPAGRDSTHRDLDFGMKTIDCRYHYLPELPVDL